MRMILPAWYDLLEERPHTQVQFQIFCSAVKTSSPSVLNFDDTPGKVLNNKKMKEAYNSKEVMEITYIHTCFV